MENVLYRLITSTADPSVPREESYANYLDYEEALACYNNEIESRTFNADASKKLYSVITNEYESNPNGQWHWCNLKSDEGNVFTIKIEPIHFFEAEYFASEDIKARYTAIYGTGDNSSNFFARLFKRKK